MVDIDPLVQIVVQLILNNIPLLFIQENKEGFVVCSSNSSSRIMLSSSNMDELVGSDACASSSLY